MTYKLANIRRLCTGTHQTRTLRIKCTVAHTQTHKRRAARARTSVHICTHMQASALLAFSERRPPNRQRWARAQCAEGGEMRGGPSARPLLYGRRCCHCRPLHFAAAAADLAAMSSALPVGPRGGQANVSAVHRATARLMRVWEGGIPLHEDEDIHDVAEDSRHLRWEGDRSRASALLRWRHTNVVRPYPPP